MIEYTVKVYDDRTEWRLNGKLHREDGPAIDSANGDEGWYLSGKYHRIGGPAIKWISGYKAWWLNGKEVTEAEAMVQVKELTVAEIETILGYSVKIVK